MEDEEAKGRSSWGYEDEDDDDADDDAWRAMYSAKSDPSISACEGSPS